MAGLVDLVHGDNALDRRHALQLLFHRDVHRRFGFNHRDGIFAGCIAGVDDGGDIDLIDSQDEVRWLMIPRRS